MQTVLSIAIDALAYGMVLFVISIGLSVTMGLMRVVNLAHGAFAMIGGYIASYAARDLGLAYGFAVLLAIFGTIIIAVPIERLLYRRIYGAPELTHAVKEVENLSFRTFEVYLVATVLYLFFSLLIMGLGAYISMRADPLRRARA